MYQPNTKANKKHACDCVVRAITVTTGKSWQETYDLLCAKGRKLQCMPNAKEPARRNKKKGYKRR